MEQKRGGACARYQPGHALSQDRRIPPRARFTSPAAPCRTRHDLAVTHRTDLWPVHHFGTGHFQTNCANLILPSALTSRPCASLNLRAQPFSAAASPARTETQGKALQLLGVALRARPAG